MAKVIKDFKIDFSSVPTVGATRAFRVEGDNGAIFSIQVKSPLGTYYDFTTNTFTSTGSGLKNKKIPGSGSFNGSIIFPVMDTGTTPKQYEIYIFAESTYDTVHAEYQEVLYEDNSVNVNLSKGSNSSILRKIIYQPADVTVTLRAGDLNSDNYSSGDFHGFSVASQSFVIGRGASTGKKAFSITVTAGATNAFEIIRQPVASDIYMIDDIKFSDYIRVPNEEVWDGTARSSGKVVDGDFSGGATNITMDDDVGTNPALWAIGDRVTGNAALDAKTGDNAVTITAINVGSNAKVFTLSESIAINNDETLTFTPPHYRRFRIASDSSGHLLKNGSTVLAYLTTYAGSVYAPTDVGIVRGYSENTEYDSIIQNEDGSMDTVSNTVVTFSVPAFDKEGAKPTVVDRDITKQLGVITFDKKLKGDTASGSTFKIITRGTSSIESVKNMKVELTNLEATLTAPTTVTTADVVNNAGIPVADREGAVPYVSTISGIGIDPTAADPFITSAIADGSGFWVVGLLQTIESGTTLTVNNTSRVLTITGEIEFSNVEINATAQTLNFDLSKFIKAY